MRDLDLTIRMVKLQDACSLSVFINQLDHECEYLLYEEGERKPNSESIKKFLLKFQENYLSAIFIAENCNREVVGYICGEVSLLKRIAHVMKVNIGVLKAYHGIGIGRLLSEKLVVYAKKVGIKRLEATVIIQNKSSLNLCKKMGMQIEGIKTHSIKINHTYYDEYLLAKIL